MKKFKHTNEELKNAQDSSLRPKNDPNCDCACHRFTNVRHIVNCC